MNNRQNAKNFAIPPGIWFLFNLALLYEMQKGGITFPTLGIDNIDHRNLQLPTTNKPNYLKGIDKNSLSIIVNQFLTIQDILILRQTCQKFKILLQRDQKTNMVEFGHIGNVSLVWFDLKHFLKQNYYTAFDSMEMFNIKKYYYAILTVLVIKKLSLGTMQTLLILKLYLKKQEIKKLQKNNILI